MAKTVPGYLGPYRLLNVVHTGPASVIWQAADDGNRRMVAVKALAKSHATSREQIAYLRQDYKVGRSADNERIIQVYGFDIDRGTPYLAMEWFAAPNLKKRLRAKDEREKFLYFLPKIIGQAAEGLGYLHLLGWVHRDVKPDNFLATDEGQTKLIDFGLAQRSGGGFWNLFRGKPKLQGTPSYMSPEQIRGTKLDPRSDIYSFGCMVYEMIVGTPPFTGVTREELFNKHLKSTPPSLEAAEGRVTSEFSRLVRTCLAKEPSGRPESLFDFLGECQRVKILRTPPRRPDANAT